MLNERQTPQICDVCGRPFRSKRNLQERSGAWSGADMCAASAAARVMPRAQMGVRRSGPIQAHALDALVAKLVVLIPSLDRAPSLSSDPPTPDSLAVVTAPTPPQPELDKPHRAPAAPRRSGPSCWPAPPAPASGLAGEHASQPRARRNALARVPACQRTGADDRQAPKGV